MTSQTGCPVQGGCNQFGYRGVAFLGEGQQYAIGGYGLDGKQALEVPNDKPCYVQLVNSRRNQIEFSLKGENVTAYMMRINYPFNTTNYTRMENGKAYRISKADDMTILYLGSTVEQQAVS